MTRSNSDSRLSSLVSLLSLAALSFASPASKRSFSEAAPCKPRDTQTLNDCLNAANVPIYLAGSSEFTTLSETYNVRLPYTPVVVVVPTTVQHVEDAVVCASQFSIPVQAKSGGHSYASYSTGGVNGAMMISLETFQDIDLDTATNVVQVGGGVRLGNLALGIHSNGNTRALSHGTCPGVGIGGHFTHGGFGLSSRAWGLAMDAIIGLDVVLANGTSVHCSSTEFPDLFWAMRGAAENFGIVTRFYLQTQEAPSTVVYFQISLDASDPKTAAGYFSGLQTFTQDASVVDRNLGIQMYMDQYSMSISGTYFGTLASFNSKVRPALSSNLGSPKITTYADSWIQSLTRLGGSNTLSTPLEGYNQHDNFYAKSLTIPTTITEDGLAAYFDFTRGSEASGNPPVDWFSIINLYGGPDSQIAARTGDQWGAYSHRGSVWVVQHYGFTGLSAAYPSGGIDFIDRLNAVLPNAMPDVDFGGYINYVDPDLSRDQAHALYYGDALSSRLAAFKGSVDPDNVFSNPQTFQP